jgi:hypothetical protein
VIFFLQIYTISINRSKETFLKKKIEKCWTAYFHAAAV